MPAIYAAPPREEGQSRKPPPSGDHPALLALSRCLVSYTIWKRRETAGDTLRLKYCFIKEPCGYTRADLYLCTYWWGGGFPPPRGAVTCLQLRTASPSALRASGPCSPWQRHRAACRAREVVCHHGFSTTISKSWVAGLPPPRTPTSCRPGEEISFRTGWSCPCWF